MNPPTKLLALTLASSLLLAGCGKKEEAEPAATKEDVKAAQAETEKSVDSKLASGFSEAQKSTEDSITKAKAEMEAKMNAELETKLAEQKKTLTAQFESSNQALRDQVDSLTKKFEDAKPKLPEPVVTSFQQKLPELKNSVTNLEQLVSSFSPSTLEQIDTFKSKYEKELTTAKTIVQELSKLLEGTKYGDMIPKL